MCGLFLAAMIRGYSLVHCSGFSCCKALGYMGSVVVAHELIGLVASWNVGSLWTGIKSVSPVGGFSTIGPPEKPQDNVFLRGTLKK